MHAARVSRVVQGVVPLGEVRVGDGPGERSAAPVVVQDDSCRRRFVARRAVGRTVSTRPTADVGGTPSPPVEMPRAPADRAGPARRPERSRPSPSPSRAPRARPPWAARRDARVSRERERRLARRRGGRPRRGQPPASSRRGHSRRAGRRSSRPAPARAAPRGHPRPGAGLAEDLGQAPLMAQGASPTSRTRTSRASSACGTIRREGGVTPGRRLGGCGPYPASSTHTRKSSTVTVPVGWVARSEAAMASAPPGGAR